MELKEVIKKRESVRDYQDKSVPVEKVKKVLEAARLAPSASNRQEWKFIVINNAEKRIELAHAAGGQSHISSAPVVIAAVATMPEVMMGCGVPAYAVDLAIAVDHITLAAVDEGLGTCWIGAFSQEKVRKILNIPEHYKVVALLTMGYSRQSGKVKIRKPFDDIVCFDTFKN